MKLILFLLVMFNFSNASSVIPITNTKFKNNKSVINLIGTPFIVISKKDNLFFAVNNKGRTEIFGEVGVGKKSSPTPEGVFSIIQRELHHMSSIYNSGTGINNMDYMLKVTHDGIALHEGDVDELSNGCVHINYIDAPFLYKWATSKTKVIITNKSYYKKSKR